MVQYFYFLKHTVVNSVGFGPGQVGEFSVSYDPTLIIADGTARVATEPEISAYIEGKQLANNPHGRLGSVPPGGADTQVLAKRSDHDYDMEWIDNTGGVGGSSSDRGLYDPGISGLYPNSGGSGTAGAIKANDYWTLSVDANVDGYDLLKGTILRALVDTPMQDTNSWSINYASGLSSKASGAEVDTGTDDVKYVTPKALEDSDYIKGANLPAEVGIVASVVAGPRVSVDNTDPENPIVSAAPTAAILVECVDSTGILETGGTSGAVYDNGTAGVGATLTSVADNIPPMVDGFSIGVGQRVLITEGTPEYFGAYVRTADVGGGTQWQLTRVAELDESGDFKTGGLVLVLSGDTKFNRLFSYRGASNPAIGTDQLQFSEVYAQNPDVGPGKVIQISTATFDFDNAANQDLMTAVPANTIRIILGITLRPTDDLSGGIDAGLTFGWDASNVGSLDDFTLTHTSPGFAVSAVLGAFSPVTSFNGAVPVGQAGDVLKAAYGGSPAVRTSPIDIMYYDIAV